MGRRGQRTDRNSVSVWEWLGEGRKEERTLRATGCRWGWWKCVEISGDSCTTLILAKTSELHTLKGCILHSECPLSEAVTYFCYVFVRCYYCKWIFLYAILLEDIMSLYWRTSRKHRINGATFIGGKIQGCKDVNSSQIDLQIQCNPNKKAPWDAAYTRTDSKLSPEVWVPSFI